MKFPGILIKHDTLMKHFHDETSSLASNGNTYIVI